MTNPKRYLPRNLTIHQAAAWVAYRDKEFALLCIDPLRYSASKFYPIDQRRVCEPTRLKAALLEGELVATGELRSGQIDLISPQEWRRLPLAPAVLERQAPYVVIWVERASLLRKFPARSNAETRGRPPEYKWDWVRDRAAKESIGSLDKLAEVLIELHFETHKSRPSKSAMKRYLREWGYGQSPPNSEL
jgi:hypothetical protein